MREGDDELTFFLLFRHAHLVLSNLTTHPQYRRLDPANKALEKQVSQNLKALDLLKPKINRRHDEYVKVLEERAQRRREEATKRPTRPSAPIADREDVFRESVPEQLRGQEHTDLAARLAGQEFSKRGSSRRSYPTASSMQNERDDLANRMQAIRNRIEPTGREIPSELGEQRQPYGSHSTGYSYPSVPAQRLPNAHSHQLDFSNYQVPSGHALAKPPELPPKPVDSRAATFPPKPDKIAAPSIPSKTQTEPSYTFAPGAYLENGTPLRTIFLPPTLRTTFLRLAYKNTQKNLETCGFLAGTLRANALFVSALIIPKQTATSDTCEMTDESELFDYVDQHDLMILGWIHTHPTQTCFMSSRDLHTHSGYQMMLAESVAIVCAPSKGDTSHGGDWGVYRLTDPPGKMAILKCDKPGIFHPHDISDIYTDAIRPGHVMEISGMDFEIVDLRHSSNGG